MRILVVDDDEISQELIGHALTSAGYEVLTARNGREALELIRAGAARMVIADWVMPEMDGVELCRQVRKGDWPGYIYFILLTSRDNKNDAVEGLSAGADDFVTKPFFSPELIVRVRCGERILAMETREMAIFAMAKLAESRDPETGGHLERIRSYCRILTKDLMEQGKFRDQGDSEFARLIYLTSPLHDIGKIGIPDSVLLKPARLSDREFNIMKTHTTIGANTLKAAIGMFPGVLFLEMAHDIALTHHEQFDGTGYPQGLAGEAIPLAGRIVALADVYDALRSSRVYKPPFSHDVARDIIVKERGKHFDPDLVDAFLRRENDFFMTVAEAPS